jgi:hypothetical protein
MSRYFREFLIILTHYYYYYFNVFNFIMYSVDYILVNMQLYYSLRDIGSSAPKITLPRPPFLASMKTGIREYSGRRHFNFDLLVKRRPNDTFGKVLPPPLGLGAQDLRRRGGL